MQRFRLTFQKGAAVKYISHLDLARAWERALRRADVALAYSHGFSPHARMFFASALPVGVTGHAEMVDVLLERPISPRELASRLQAQLPDGLDLVGAEEVALTLPPLPSQVVAVEYEVCVASRDSTSAMQARLDGLLAAPSLPRRMGRAGKLREYDLRPLIQRLWLVGRRGGLYVIGMWLQADSRGTGRPDEVVDALGLREAARAIERTQIRLQIRS